MRDLELGKAIRHGLFAWLLGLLLHLVPVVLVGFWLTTGAGLGFLSAGSQLAAEVWKLYGGNWLLVAAITFVAAVIVVWRAWAVANRTGPWRLANGLLVGLVPAVLWLVVAIFGGFDMRLLIVAAAYLAAGLLGGILAQP